MVLSVPWMMMVIMVMIMMIAAPGNVFIMPDTDCLILTIILYDRYYPILQQRNGSPGRLTNLPKVTYKVVQPRFKL